MHTAKLSCYRESYEDRRKIAEKKIRKLVQADALQVGFMQGRGITDLLFVVRTIWEKERKLHKCFVDTEKAFDRVPTMVMECIFSLPYTRFLHLCIFLFTLPA